MKNGNNIFYIKLLGVFSILIILLVSVYTIQLRKVVEHNIIESISETALHDRRSIKTCIEFFIEDLKGIAKRLALYECRTIPDMETRLNLENASTEFTHIYLLAEDGRIYTDRFLVYDPKKSNLAARIDLLPLFPDDSVEVVVSRFDDKAEFAGISRESILYGIRLHNYSVDGIKMIALIGIADINFLQNHMIIDSFTINGKPHGYSSVIDYNGNYIIGNDKSIYLNDSNNFFHRLESGRNSTLTREKILQKMKKAETFNFHVNDEKEKLIYFAPFENGKNERINWYFIMSVDNDVLVKRQFTFTMMSLILLVVAVLIMSSLAFYGLSNHNKLFKANEAIKVRSEFLSNMSHEIRTPLNGLIGLNYLISNAIDNKGKTAQVRDWLNKSKSLADYLLSLLNDILDMSKLHSGKIDIINVPFSVEHMIDDIWFMQKDNIERRGVTLIVEKDIPVPWVRGDEVRTKQVLVNIVGNAAKFTPQGGRITLSTSQRREDDARVTTIYRCEDTGIGMNRAFLEKIFDPFSQERDGKSDATLKGTGLGMPISKELVDAMGGEIHVESVPGQGSVFTVIIPSVIAEAVPDAEAAPAHDSTPEEGLRGGKILLAEDAEFNAEFLTELLRDEGFDVVHAENGQATLEKFRESAVGEFDIILMDMQMPVMDGCEAAAAIRKLDRPDARTVIIFACTANTFKEDMDRALRSGMNDFLTKPINIKVFLEKMRRQGRGREQARS